ncbi:MAG: tRNA-binding protein [Roseofilum sp. SBFL]|uniref:tRNA-binding protein n=1 Tax=unclassified Roseofilum TaxID=2620099 RepID=UPI001B0C6D05|nr:MULTISPECIES: tRNA-binding protein [unclassified Roseofilum]MBP0015721.1 tRNA-binding protein [Roseofilum sp. SID3]MBP0024164.1 tRNA-binding protein [Roseofilum sp. SID2]MBP0039836.1 tRNA-binding protein [Roseofilum sp. SID1]MBP0044409.1 tRNA-binding protein [Roseofilum sp. SBFL]
MFPEINFSDFLKLDLRVGTILQAEDNVKAKNPAYILKIDFGTLGIKTSSAQITQNYSKESLVHTQVICVMNFAPKRVAGVKSEVLVLAAVSEEQGTVLITPGFKVENGTKIS